MNLSGLAKDFSSQVTHYTGKSLDSPRNLRDNGYTIKCYGCGAIPFIAPVLIRVDWVIRPFSIAGGLPGAFTLESRCSL